MAREHLLQRAAEAVCEAEGLLVGAGAGMGVDSGLPDFRGDQGFWRAYPPCAERKLSFAAMANPAWFATDPTFAWGFYGHRLNLYRKTVPHRGFELLRRWGDAMPHGHFVFTSNVDGQFHKAGFQSDRICEAHGTIHHLQCTRDCGIGIFDATQVQVAVDETTLRAGNPLPSCPSCGALARPNVLMFGDMQWDSSRTDEQERRLSEWCSEVSGARLVVIECGAGTAIPTVRYLCERLGARRGAMLVRINVREPEVPQGHVGLAMGALEALTSIAERVAALRS